MSMVTELPDCAAEETACPFQFVIPKDQLSSFGDIYWLKSTCTSEIKSSEEETNDGSLKTESTDKFGVDKKSFSPHCMKMGCRMMDWNTHSFTLRFDDMSRLWYHLSVAIPLKANGLEIDDTRRGRVLSNRVHPTAGAYQWEPVEITTKKDEKSHQIHLTLKINGQEEELAVNNSLVVDQTVSTSMIQDKSVSVKLPQKKYCLSTVVDLIIHHSNSVKNNDSK